MSDPAAYDPDLLKFPLPRPSGGRHRERPNVVVFFTDQQRWDTVGALGNPLGLTPNFDRAAEDGTLVERSFTVQPVCGPSRACLQTGRYATQNGTYRNEIPLAADVHTLGAAFRDAGYRTGYIGKWHLASRDPVPEGERAGYQDWLAANKLEFTSDAYHTVVYGADERPVKLPGYRVDALTDAAIRYLDAHQAEPFFLFLSHLEPHHQNHVDAYPAPHGFEERFGGSWLPTDLAALGGSSARHLPGYLGMVKRLDEAFGRVLDALDSLGLREDTVVLFTSDHGNHFKTRNAEYKRSGHDASLRVPTVLTGPGFEGGSRVRELVSILDLHATLLDAAGLPPGAGVEGRSILPLLRPGPHDWPDALFFQVSESEVGRGLRTDRWKYGVHAPGADPWTQAHADRYVEAYLYDLAYDPFELENLIGQASHQGVAAGLRERLLAAMARIGEPAAAIDPAPAKPRYEQRQVLPGEEEA